MKTKYLDVNGIHTRYLEAGSGEALLLLHGGHFGVHSSANVWDLNIDLFSRNFHVLAIDKIGCGFTDNPKEDRDYVIGSAVWHAHDFLKTLKIKAAHVVGHSRGGYQACRLALEYPEVVKTLTIVDSGTLMLVAGPIVFQDLFDEEAGQIKDIKERYRYKLATFSFSQAHITDGLINNLVQVAELPKSRQAAARMEAGLKYKFREDMIARQKETHEWIKAGRLKVPTLIVWGFNDPAAKLDPRGLDAMRLIFPAVPQSQMVILNQAGHFCFREQPEAFVTAVTEFIKTHPAPRA